MTCDVEKVSSYSFMSVICAFVTLIYHEKRGLQWNIYIFVLAQVCLIKYLTSHEKKVRCVRQYMLR